VFVRSDWGSSPQGKTLQAWEEQTVLRCTADLFGYNALQIGQAHADFLAWSRIPLRVCGDQNAGDVYLQPELLPFAGTSLDLVILPHVLEFSNHPHHVLREIERVLVPEGHVLILGFNPWSLFGLQRGLIRGYARCARKPSLPYPWSCMPLSLPRLKDWLALLSFEIRTVRLGPPLFASRTPLAGFAGGSVGQAYFLHAVKKVHGMRLIRPEWQLQGKGLRQWVSAVSRQWPSKPTASEKDRPS
jgi:SAM-dependent methyltransferase